MMSRSREEAKELPGTYPGDEINEEFLAEYTLEGKWDEVVKIYNKYRRAHITMIDEFNGTALHVAVDMYEEQVVADLVKAIIDQGDEGHAQRALQKTNEQGDTPLHLAASKGFARICQRIIGEKKERLELLSCRNKQGETPLFVAAINWQKQAFAYLSDISKDDVTLFDLVRDDGDSILHCAIQREYFDLAVIIVHYYDFLSSHCNDEGFTPLKVFATRRSAFWSGHNLTWWELILYYCTPVQPLDPEGAMKSLLRKMKRKPADPNKTKYPKNYSTCYDIYSLVAALVGNVPGMQRNKEKDQQNQGDAENPPNKQNDNRSTNNEGRSVKYGILPPNYDTSKQFVTSAYVHALGLSGVELKAVKKMKQKHKWSRQLLKALMKRPYAAFTGAGGQPEPTITESWNVDPDDMLSIYRRWKQGENSIIETPEEPSMQGDSRGGTPNQNDTKNRGTEPAAGETSIMGTPQKDKEKGEGTEPKKPDKRETAFLVAARNGIVELVNEILSKIPSAIHNTNSEKENVLLVAVNHRHPHVVEALRTQSKPEFWNNLLLGVDKYENTILHLAAHALSEEKPLQIPGSALQMMWDIKWFEYIKSLVPQHFYFRTNKEHQTAEEIFKEKHKSLIKESTEWLKDTSESCSVVAGLIAGVSYATASSVPGGTEETGRPTLEGQPAFDAFAIASLIGLCFSVTGLIMFLSILTSRKQAENFRRDLPLKLLLGLSSLFVSIASLFVSFCTGHFFLLEDKYKQVLFPIYVATCLPVTFYAVAQFPLYVDLLRAVLGKVPQKK